MFLRAIPELNNKTSFRRSAHCHFQFVIECALRALATFTSVLADLAYGGQRPCEISMYPTFDLLSCNDKRYGVATP